MCHSLPTLLRCFLSRFLCFNLGSQCCRCGWVETFRHLPRGLLRLRVDVVRHSTGRVLGVDPGGLVSSRFHSIVSL